MRSQEDAATELNPDQPRGKPRAVPERVGQPRPLVAASIGCYGAALADGSEYRGDYGEAVGVDGLKDWHRERFRVLAGSPGTDFVAFETVPCLREVEAILSLLQVRAWCNAPPCRYA